MNSVLFLEDSGFTVFVLGFCRPSAKMTFSTSRAGPKTEELTLREPTPPLVPPAMLTSQFPSAGLDKDKLAELLSVACSMHKPTTPAPRSVLLCFACASSTP